VLGATLDGEILWTIPWPEKSGVYANAGEYLPTSVAVASDGAIYVADGYGKSWIHEFDRERKYVRTFGGPGSEVGKLATPHGLWLDTRGGAPVLLVADRENHRLQSFDLEGKSLGVVATDLRRPCHMHQRGGELVVADLAGRITLLDAKNKVTAHLGDNPDPALRAQYGVPREKWRDGEFLAPHCATFDAQGNVYVVDWNHLGRVTKLARAK
jgi:DNA-binding beta-propeller fold protein YncE